MATRPKTREVDWRWVAGCEIPGGVLLGLACYFQAAYEWQGASEALMIAVGTALGLCGVLFFFERRFLRDVGAIAAREGASAASAQVTSAVSGISSRLDRLSEEMRRVLGEEATSFDKAIAGIDTPTFATVATALAYANSSGALLYDHVTVQGSVNPDELGLKFSWGQDLGDGRFGRAPHHALAVEAVLYNPIAPQGRTPYINIEWQPHETAVEVGIRMHQELTARGQLRSTDTLNFEQALRNLQRALDVAVRSRRRDPAGPKLHGPLAELVGNDWMITEAGLECPSHDGYLFSEREFPARLGPINRRQREEWSPQRPDWADEALWVRLLQRGQRIFPIERGPMIMTPTWIAENQTPSELGIVAPATDEANL